MSKSTPGAETSCKMEKSKSEMSGKALPEGPACEARLVVASIDS
jgi:hypothetical protein